MKEAQDGPEWPVLRLYEFISGPADKKRPWDEMRTLFLDGARLRMVVRLEDGSEKLREWTLDEFARDAGEFYSQDGFWEREVSRRVERFGSIAHVFSTYESRVKDPDGPPVMRGINSIQLILGRNRWLIASVVFQTEQEEVPIPPEYLKQV
ncbi:MAG: hypothetical protein PVJ42_03185 [bacterium]|jgi:hypothetical protein